MPKQMKKRSKPKSEKPTTLTLSEKLLAMTFVKGLQPTEAAVRLEAIGFEPRTIAPLLGKTANAVRTLLSRARRGRR